MLWVYGCMGDILWFIVWNIEYQGLLVKDVVVNLKCLVCIVYNICVVYGISFSVLFIEIWFVVVQYQFIWMNECIFQIVYGVGFFSFFYFFCLFSVWFGIMVKMMCVGNCVEVIVSCQV